MFSICLNLSCESNMVLQVFKANAATVLARTWLSRTLAVPQAQNLSCESNAFQVEYFNWNIGNRRTHRISLARVMLFRRKNSSIG